jgi:hypothetical protein
VRIDFSFKFLGSTRFMARFFAVLAASHVAIAVEVALLGGDDGWRLALIALVLAGFYALASLAFWSSWRSGHRP